MKESIRRFFLFAVIIITGSVLILFDVPLIILIPLALMVGFILLLLLGAISVEEIKSALGNLKPGNLKKIGIFKRLDGMKFFEKSSAAKPDKKPSLKTETKQTVKGPEKVKGQDKKSGISGHLNSFVSSIRSLGTLLKQLSRHEKKVEDINKMLDSTVSEKVETNSARASAGKIVDTPLPAPAGGAGSATQDQAKDQDPFLSLAEDEFDTSILDSLDEQETLPPAQAGALSAPPELSGAPSIDINEPDIPLPSLDIDGEVGNILKDNAQGLEEFSSLDSGEGTDQDFGDLDSINLDDVDFGEDDETKAPVAPTTSPAAAPAGKAASTLRKTSDVKTDWVKSDAPKGAADQTQDQIATQADMASFSSGPSSDADMLSSLASDIKQVEKKADLSLLRELKDFKAPSSDIENELSEMYERMKVIPDTGKKAKPPAGGIK